MPRVFDRKVAVSVIAAKHCIDSSIALMMVMMSYYGKPPSLTPLRARSHSPLPPLLCDLNPMSDYFIVASSMSSSRCGGNGGRMSEKCPNLTKSKIVITLEIA